MLFWHLLLLLLQFLREHRLWHNVPLGQCSCRRASSPFSLHRLQAEPEQAGVLYSCCVFGLLVLLLLLLQEHWLR
jgi:hypothetical protein